jgi:hypothetical protein
MLIQLEKVGYLLDAATFMRDMDEQLNKGDKQRHRYMNSKKRRPAESIQRALKPSNMSCTNYFYFGNNYARCANSEQLREMNSQEGM